MLSDKELEHVNKLAHKDAIVSKLLSEYDIFISSPRSESYLMLYGIIDAWKNEMSENASAFKILTAEDKLFERAFKVADKISSLLDSLDDIREKMLPEERENIDKKRMAKKSEGQVVLQPAR